MTNWVPQHAAVSSKLSTRARTLSQRRTSRHNQEPIDLSQQDRPLDRESWIEPKGEYDVEDDVGHHHDHDHLDEDIERRGREEERAVVA